MKPLWLQIDPDEIVIDVTQICNTVGDDKVFPGF